ncbi:MAG: hypothetical protein WC091_12775 [Sulfuricellaceae bacterium]
MNGFYFIRLAYGELAILLRSSFDKLRTNGARWQARMILPTQFHIEPQRFHQLLVDGLRLSTTIGLMFFVTILD